MKTPTLLELRRVLGHALLAAPLVIACNKGPAPESNQTPGDAGTLVHIVPFDAATVRPPPADAATTGTCRHDPPDVTGCGGAEVTLHSSLADCKLPAAGVIPMDRCDEFCGGFDTRECRVYERYGKPAVYCSAANPCLGRMASDGALDGARGDGIVDHLVLARQMEAHSVAAFRELEADLARWGAPPPLLDACRRAAADEARHAQAMSRLLRQRGAVPDRLPPRTAAGFASLRDLALHNEREGVVGETWGALIARHQAAHAAAADVRAAMAEVADEETAHAALSFEIAAWARTQLDAPAAAALDDERRAAFAALRETLGYRPGATAAAPLGWPSAAKRAAMLEALAPMLA